MKESEEEININEFINGDTSEAEVAETENVETENVENMTGNIANSSYSNEDLKEIHKTIIEFLEFLSGEYEKNEE